MGLVIAIAVLCVAMAFIVGYEWGYKRGWRKRDEITVSPRTIDRLKHWEVDDGGV